MSWLSRLSDKLILFPSVDSIDTDGKERLLVPIPQGNAEVWASQTVSTVDNRNVAKIAVLKFTGNAGRAENVGCHPFDELPHVQADVWAVNHCGYGGSDGRASLSSIATTCDATFAAFRSMYPGRPLYVCGNSIGCLSALYLGARYSIDALFLRNGPPLQQMIAKSKRFNWWNFGFAKYLAGRLPRELDCIENALRCSVPAMFVQSECDQVVPVEYQDMIFQAYADEKRMFVIPGADHDSRIPDRQMIAFREMVEWLMTQSTSK